MPSINPQTVNVDNVNPNGQATMANSSPVTIALDQSPIPIQDVGVGSTTPLEVGTTVSAGASGTVTLAGVAAKYTYIRGFKISSAAAAAIVSGLVTVTGLTNTLSFYYDNLATGQSDLEIYFGEAGVRASAVNTSIVVNFPAITGGAATAIAAWGYQL